jgi:lipoprotein-releasing system permease protein
MSRGSDIYGATDFADQLHARTGLQVESWMQANEELLVALRSQSASSNLIQIFVTLAVAIGIASVLVVSVVQRSREIGILRAMGVSRKRILRVFLIQGAVVGLFGSLVGGAMGSGLSLAFMNLAASPNGEPLFPLLLTPALLGGAGAIAIVTGLAAAFMPALRAAKLDPVAAIRND